MLSEEKLEKKLKEINDQIMRLQQNEIKILQPYLASKMVLNLNLIN